MYNILISDNLYIFIGGIQNMKILMKHDSGVSKEVKCGFHGRHFSLDL
ncbi:hypothetical protein JTT01_22060 [Clostridium botulinum]|nr:hypothetical protein [Clostridium botulinum]MCS4468666.1 hypothetical protein [Clostridium botulinum]MCS4477491.1 hypothetical protein [Clostridium botulinum]MCS4516604.1 hypothetical protein [Clostridium botulinum]